MTEEPTDTPQPPDAERGATAGRAGTATGPWRFASMIGSSIAARDAAPWVTDFLNAAYYRRPADERDVDDLRLASAIVTTYWYRKEPRRRLRAFDLPAFHRAFGRARFDTARSGRGTLDHQELLDGSARLLGDWFPDAYADDERRGWGIAFATTQERDGYDPGVRLALAPVGELTPERAPPAEQVWHTYPPVAMPSAEAVIDALTRPERWPDFASEIGRFTPLRPGGLPGQTFEIEVGAGTETGRPLFTRGYVTVTQLVTPDDPAALQGWFGDVQRGMATYGREEPELLPPGATPLVGFDLTTHAGHFMGSGHNRLLLYEHEGHALVRAAGTWDPMPWHLERAYQLSGRDAQHAFWGQGGVERLSMLHQLAERA
jgi:hypothetical protein